MMEMRKEPSVEFELDGLQDSDSSPQKEKLVPQSTEDTQFREADFSNDSSAELVLKLQRTLKSEQLILHHEEKRRQDNIKLVQCCTRNTVEKWLMSRCAGEECREALLLNEKDLQDIQQTLPGDLNKLFQQLLKGSDLSKLLLVAPLENSGVIIDDLSNFFPHYQELLESLLRRDVREAARVDGIFQLKYSLTSKFLDGLYQRFECEIFSRGVLERGLDRLVAVRSELSVDFSHEYERLKELIGEGRPNLKQFVHGDPSHVPNSKLIEELEGVIGSFEEPADIENIIEAVRLTQLHPENRQALIEEFKAKLEAQEDYINLKIGMLTLKSVSISRQTVQEVVGCFMEDILDGIDAYPSVVRQLVRTYETLCRQKFPQFTNEDLKDFLVKTVFSKWLSTELMRYYCARSQLSPQTTNANFSIVCLVLQKILYNKPFVEREFYSCFNELISHYSQRVASFTSNFGREQLPQNPPLKLLVVSLESVRVLLRLFKDNIAMFPQYEQYLKLEPALSRQSYQMGNSRYLLKNLYVQYVEVGSPALVKVFLPREKLRRILIQFLLAIPEVSEPVSIHTLLERHKYGADVGPTSKAPVELYANYLQTLIYPGVDLTPLVNTIYEQLEDVKRQERESRVVIETTKTYYDNLEKVFVALSKEQVGWLLDKRIDELIKSVRLRLRLILKRGEFVKFESTKDSQHRKSDKSVDIFESESVEGFLRQLSQIYLSQGMHEKQQPITVKNVYQQFVEHVLTELEKPLKELRGESPDAKSKRVADRIGSKLYSMYLSMARRLRIGKMRTPADKSFQDQLQKLRFVTMKHLEERYQLEEPLFTEVAMQLPAKLSRPLSTEGILKVLHQINLTFQQVILSTGKASDITADIQIPLVQLMLIRTYIPNVHSLLRFLDSFIMQDSMNSVLGQTLTLLHGSVVLLTHMTGQKLGLTEQEFDKLMTA